MIVLASEETERKAVVFGGFEAIPQTGHLFLARVAMCKLLLGGCG